MTVHAGGAADGSAFGYTKRREKRVSASRVRLHRTFIEPFRPGMLSTFEAVVREEP